MDYKIAPGEYHASSSNKRWYEERNKQLYKDKSAGMSEVDLVTKYQITPARVRYLFSKERDKHGRDK